MHTVTNLPSSSLGVDSVLIFIILLHQMHIKHTKRRKIAQKVADPSGIATYNVKEVSFPESVVPGK